VKKKTLLIIFLKYGVGLGVLAFVIWKYWNGLQDAFRHDIHQEPLLLTTGIFLIGLFITFFRWYVLVRAQGLPLTAADSLRLGLVGFYYSQMLPSSVGGDIIKAACIAFEQQRRTVAVATVMVDRVVGLCALIALVALIGVPLWVTGQLREMAKTDEAYDRLQMLVLLAVGLTAVSFSGWFIAGFMRDQTAERVARGLERIPKIGHSLAELWRALHMYRRGNVIAAAVLMSLGGHVCFVLTFYYAAQTMSPASNIPGLGVHFLIVPVAMAFAGAFPAPGGIGGMEFACGELYKLVGFGAAEGVLMALVYRLVNWVLAFIGYLVYLRMKPTLQPAEPAAVEEQPVAG
jgi:glycosyltransferase 2 family protein